MKIYVTSSWGNREAVAYICEWLIGQGHTITSTWQGRHYPPDVPSDWWASIDLAEIDGSNAVLAYTDHVESDCRGAMDFEAGYGFASGKQLFWIGPDARNIFLSRYGERWHTTPAIPPKLLNLGS